MNDVHGYRRALIVGAGVAGLTSALVLRRQGWSVDVVEQAEGLRDGGYKVDIRGSAVDVIDRLGLLEPVRAADCGVRAGSVVGADGRVVAAMKGDTLGGRGREDVEIERGDLVRILADAAGEANFGRRVESLSQKTDRVKVTFADGSEGRYDVVVGADGLHSRIRGLAGIDGGVSPLASMGYAIAVTQMPDAMGLDREETTFVRPGATVMTFRTAVREDARAMVLFSFDGELPEVHERRVALLRRVLPDPVWQLPRVLQAFEDAPGFYMDTLTQVNLPAWHEGRVVLVGDSAGCASPASGQGTTLALLGAYVTMTLLGRRPDDPAAAFTEAHAMLTPLVETNQSLGRSNITRMVLPHRRAVAATLFALRVLRLLRMEDAVLGVVAKRLDKASRLSLPADAA
ncbi:FAD-dependent monooxygenase [Mobilicoccus massiliensis]|uniref:FAD-dependent monooxygenase n=1 Tax=Mobilicoccus massiliensis TaxID=1522310 RepID=UPI00058B03BE|nr:FAD-dependent monooxygenase [Mobilicoccus massiliensis]